MHGPTDAESREKGLDCQFAGSESGTAAGCVIRHWSVSGFGSRCHHTDISRPFTSKFHLVIRVSLAVSDLTLSLLAPPHSSIAFRLCSVGCRQKTTMVLAGLDQWPLSGPATAALGLLAVYALLYALQFRKHDPREPPIVPSRLPFVGHLVGMALLGGRYTKQLGAAHRDKAIFTLPVPFSRIYLVTDPSLAAAVQRASRALSFTPLVPDITKRVLGLDAATVAQVRLDLDPEPGAPRGFLAEMHDMVYAFLGPGDDLNELSLRAARELAAQVNAFAAGLGPAGHTVDLLAWSRHLVTAGTAAFLYGADNPLARHPPLESAFWDFVHGLGPLLIGLAPSLTARRAYRAREALVAAFAAYLADGAHRRPDASEIVRRRVAIAERRGWALEPTARSELSFLFAGIINTAVSAFWVALRVFADPALLRAVRAEVLRAATLVPPTPSDDDDDDAAAMETLALSIEAVRTGCPTLAAVFRESLRLGSDNFSTRLAKADTLLAGQHFVRGGAVVQVAAGVIHADTRLWGADAATFDAERFARLDRKDGGGPGGGPGVHPAAFRAFGGGKTLCPGRHFATSEILGFVAVLVALFDLEPADDDDSGGGPAVLRVPEKNDRVLPVHILEPRAEDVPRVRVKLRGGRRRRVVAVP